MSAFSYRAVACAHSDFPGVTVALVPSDHPTASSRQSNGTTGFSTCLASGDPNIIPGSVFRIEDANYIDGDPRKGRRALQFYGARYKCYALYTRDERGDPEIVKASSHGVGVYNAPSKALREIQKSGLPRWLENAWLSLLRDVHGLPTERPVGDYPAIRQLTMSTYNIWKHYSKTSKPFDFLVVATTIPRYKELYGCGCDDPRPATFPYDDARDWKKQKWICMTCGRPVKIVRNGILLVKTYGDVLHEMMFAGFQRKRLTASGESPTYAHPSVGLTKSRPVVIEGYRYCGKEVVVDASRAPEEEGLTAEELNATEVLEYRKPAAQDAQRLLAEGVDAARGAGIVVGVEDVGVSRTTAWRTRKGRSVREKTARNLQRACEGETPYNLVDDNDLRKLVRAVGIKEIARLAGLSQRTVFYFMEGRKPSGRTVMRILFALGRIYVECEAQAD